MTAASTPGKPFSYAASWSNRVLLLALAGILFLTLYPFRFDFVAPSPGGAFPLALGGWGKGAGAGDAFLNVLLFVPFGFGLAVKLRGSDLSKPKLLAVVFAAGVVLSYTIELLQLYIPDRDSGWEDVVTNSVGAGIGSLIFEFFGQRGTLLLSASERRLESFFTFPVAIVSFVLYLGIWFAASVPLQHRLGFSGWKPDCLLVVGNRVQGRLFSAWKGEIFQLEIWDRALPHEVARRVSSGGPRDASDFRPSVAYDFSGSAPFRDQQGLLPDLAWSARAPASPTSEGAVLNGDSWLISRGPVSALVDDLKRTGQFSVHVVCAPSQIHGIDGRIVSVSDAAPLGDLELRQDENHFVVWFRNALLLKWPHVAWNHADIFSARQRRDILVSYDGANLTVFIDGKRQRGNYELGPGASLAMMIGRGKSAELIGYRYIFYALIFCPVGCLLALASRKLPARSLSRVALIVSGAVLPPILFEILIVHLSGRRMSLGSVTLSVLLVLGGALWINADRTVAIGALQQKIGDSAT